MNFKVDTAKDRPIREYRFRPTVHRPTLVTARVPTALAEALDAERRRLGVSKSELVFAALEQFLQGSKN